MMRWWMEQVGAGQHEHGGTLMEVLTVVALLAIGAALAGPDVRGLQRQLETALFAREVASELRQARQLAITRRQGVLLVFDRGRRVIEAQVGPSRVLHHVFPYHDRGIEVEEPTAGAEVSFHPSGRTATPTTIVFHHTHGEAGTITVSLTGRVTIR